MVPRPFFVRADLAEPADCFRVIDSAAEEFGALDGLVNCTGSTKRGTLEGTTVDLWNHLFNVNTRAPFLLSQRIVPHLRKQGGGTIVNIGSVAAHSGQPYIMAYSAAKAALLTLTRNMANSLKWGSHPGQCAQHRLDGDADGARPASQLSRPRRRLAGKGGGPCSPSDGC